MRKKAVIVFSGGQDSTTCLIHALPKYDEIHCVTFDYGQRHREEIDVARQLAKELGVTAHSVLDVKLLNDLSVSSLTRDNIPVPTANAFGSELPNTFVPGRNIVFLTLASIYAYRVRAQTVISGICDPEYSGYPDCREDFVETLNTAIKSGMEYDLQLETPLIWMTKAEIWALAEYHGQLDFIRQKTLSCYNGIKGNGCGKCGVCKLRSNGFQEFQKNQKRTMNSLRYKLSTQTFS